MPKTDRGGRCLKRGLQSTEVDTLLQPIGKGKSSFDRVASQYLQNWQCGQWAPIAGVEHPCTVLQYYDEVAMVRHQLVCREGNFIRVHLKVAMAPAQSFCAVARFQHYGIAMKATLYISTEGRMLVAPLQSFLAV